MLQGASPQVACRKLDIPLDAFWRGLERNAKFAAQIQQVWDALSFNVVAALYQAAMQGNSSAQQFWLKHRPPPRWTTMGAEPSPADDLDAMTHDELLERVQEEAPDLAVAFAAGAAAARRGQPSTAVSGAPEGAGA